MAVWLSLRDFFRHLDGLTKSWSVLTLIVIGTVSLTTFTVSTMATAIGDSDDLGVAVRLMAVVVGLSFAVSASRPRSPSTRGWVPETT
jgi:uncharacterized membrane protein